MPRAALVEARTNHGDDVRPGYGSIGSQPASRSSAVALAWSALLRFSIRASCRWDASEVAVQRISKTKGAAWPVLGSASNRGGATGSLASLTRRRPHHPQQPVRPLADDLAARPREASALLDAALVGLGDLHGPARTPVLARRRADHRAFCRQRPPLRRRRAAPRPASPLPAALLLSARRRRLKPPRALQCPAPVPCPPAAVYLRPRPGLDAARTSGPPPAVQPALRVRPGIRALCALRHRIRPLGRARPRPVTGRACRAAPLLLSACRHRAAVPSGRPGPAPRPSPRRRQALLPSGCSAVALAGVRPLPGPTRAAALRCPGRPRPSRRARPARRRPRPGCARRPPRPARCVRPAARSGLGRHEPGTPSRPVGGMLRSEFAPCPGPPGPRPLPWSQSGPGPLVRAPHPAPGLRRVPPASVLPLPGPAKTRKGRCAPRPADIMSSGADHGPRFWG